MTPALEEDLRPLDSFVQIDLALVRVPLVSVSLSGVYMPNLYFFVCFPFTYIVGRQHARNSTAPLVFHGLPYPPSKNIAPVVFRVGLVRNTYPAPAVSLVFAFGTGLSAAAAATA